MFGLPDLPDFSKITPMIDESLELFRQLSADVQLIKTQQAEILALLKPQAGDSDHE